MKMKTDTQMVKEKTGSTGKFLPTPTDRDAAAALRMNSRQGE